MSARSSRSGVAARVLVVLALVGSFALPLSRSGNRDPQRGSAKPAPLSADIAAARLELAKLDDRLDIADENYRNGQIALAQAKVDQAAADRSLAAGKARRAALQQQVDGIAALAYETGGDPDVLLATPTGAGELAESTAVLSNLVDSQATTLHAAAAAQYDLAVAQTAADQSAASTAAKAAALAATKADILTQVARHKAIVDSLVDRQHRLEVIAAEKARLARLAEAKAKAEHAAAARRAAQRAADAAAAAARKAAADAAAAKAAAEQEAAKQGGRPSRCHSTRARGRRRCRCRRSQATPSGSTGTAARAAAPVEQWLRFEQWLRLGCATAAGYQQAGRPRPGLPSRWRPRTGSWAPRTQWAADGPGAFDCSGTHRLRLGGRRRLAAALVAGSVLRRQPRLEGQSGAGRPGLLRQPDPPRRDLRRSRRHDRRARRPVTLCGYKASAGPTTRVRYGLPAEPHGRDAGLEAVGDRRQLGQPDQPVAVRRGVGDRDGGAGRRRGVAGALRW